MANTARYAFDATAYSATLEPGASDGSPEAQSAQDAAAAAKVGGDIAEVKQGTAALLQAAEPVIRTAMDALAVGGLAEGAMANPGPDGQKMLAAAQDKLDQNVQPVVDRISEGRAQAAANGTLPTFYAYGVVWEALETALAVVHVLGEASGVSKVARAIDGVDAAVGVRAADTATVAGEASTVPVVQLGSAAGANTTQTATLATESESALKALGPDWQVLAPAGQGAATGTLPSGYQTVSRWSAQMRLRLG